MLIPWRRIARFILDRLPWFAGICTLYPIAWMIVTSISIMTNANSAWIAEPVFVYPVYATFWLAPIINLSGLTIAISRTRRAQVLFFASCCLVWLGMFALLSFAHR